MGTQETMKDFVESLVKNLVDRKDDVRVDVSVSTKAVLIQIKTAREDTGKVIGKKGRTIEAIKVVALAAKNTKFPGDSKSVSIEVLEDENSSFKINRK
jgi:predicted RNA-binding protein YlqC (UPF0109 family)